MRFGRTHGDDDGGIQIAPMIDIVFLLLIFFVSTSVFYRLEAEMDIVIPTSEEAQPGLRTPGKVIVNVKKDGTLVVNQRTLSLSDLTDILKKLSAVAEGQSVIVRGDAEARHQDIMKVLDACAKANIWNVSFAALTEEEKI